MHPCGYGQPIRSENQYEHVYTYDIAEEDPRPTQRDVSNCTLLISCCEITIKFLRLNSFNTFLIFLRIKDLIFEARYRLKPIYADTINSDIY
jgi:hypothetical protein